MHRDAKKVIAKWESLHKVTRAGVIPYLDRLSTRKDLWTVGYGTTMFAGERITGNSGPFTAEECWDMLSALVDRKYAPGVARVVKTRIHPLMFDALISFSYNVGLSALKHSTLLRRINSGRSDLAIREFKRWNKSGGSVRRGLTRRRKEEAAMFSLGYFYLTYGNDDWYDEKLILPQRPR